MAPQMVCCCKRSETDVLRRSSRTKQTVQPTAPTKKAPAKKAKKPKVKVTKGKASDSSQEPNAAPAQNGENKEA
ncbi:hypothetical protein scyTo_0011739 [Scyliorhinus torazame]|uniref:Uncharacterized protein n=1 Tax=Scyliorhinus torazame TaxID=75743 RepID=A0A401NU30_SCYTO|nr:hypothetical protein [Scyliorhinus torazame]